MRLSAVDWTFKASPAAGFDPWRTFQKPGSCGARGRRETREAHFPGFIFHFVLLRKFEQCGVRVKMQGDVLGILKEAGVLLIHHRPKGPS